MANVYTRPRHPHPITRYWQYFLILSAPLLVVGVVAMLTSEREEDLLSGFYLFVGGIIVGMICLILFILQDSRKPLSGRVINRFISVSGFPDRDFTDTDTIDQMITDGRMQHPETLYWLLVFPDKGGASRWFAVPKDVFYAYPTGMDYDTDHIQNQF